MTISVRAPSTERVLELAESFGMRMNAAEAASFAGLMGGSIESYRRVDELAMPAQPVTWPRTPGHQPAPEENPLNAWYWRCEVKGAAEGALAGRSVAIKDNIFVAGVPLMNGSRLLEGFVPAEDATVVMRILDAGGTIAGKAACEDLCFSAGSHTCATGPIRNPHNPAHSAGGSSGGSAALVASGAVDMALGGDQGGSIRTPSAWCGAYGLKPTWGLVPVTGSMPIAYAIDHCGPICGNVADVATLLSVIAGRDPLDPRTALADVQDYRAALGQGVQGLRIGLLQEGFAHGDASDPATSAKVRAAIEVLQGQGATVEEVSVPMHYDAPHVWTAIIVEGAAEMMLKGNGQGSNWNGHHSVALVDAFARGWQSRPDDLSETCKLVLLLGEYMKQDYHGRYHAKGLTLQRAVKAAYDTALEQCDALVMPTIPFPATKIPLPGCSREEYVELALNMQHNTCPFDVAGHPAFTIPCGKVDGLPVGLMIVTRHFDEAMAIRIADAYAGAVDWTTA
ncbi:MAG: amidase [Sneathiellaceae bacterium]